MISIEDLELDEETIILDGLDDCVVGVSEEFGKGQRLPYDRDKILKKLQFDGMTYEEAFEFYDYNILGLYAGELNPIFLISDSTLIDNS